MMLMAVEWQAIRSEQSVESGRDLPQAMYCKILIASDSQQATHNKQLTTSDSQQATHNKLLTISGMLSREADYLNE